MKAKHAVTFFIFGYCFDFIGALYRVTHRPNGDTLLLIGAVLKVAGALLFLFKLITYPGFKNFMNK